jgi:hypothetical protein
MGSSRNALLSEDFESLLNGLTQRSGASESHAQSLPA